MPRLLDAFLWRSRAASGRQSGSRKQEAAVSRIGAAASVVSRKQEDL
jgi:hypothetical protein